MSRYTTCMHGDVVTKESRKFDGRKVDEALFGSFLHRSVEHVRQDLCQTEEVQVELANFSFSVQDVSIAFSILKEFISDFQLYGHADKFYPKFYDCIFGRHQEIFPTLSLDTSFSACMNVCDQILVFLSIEIALKTKLKMI